MEQYKYYAFISYSSHDTEWGKRLQQKLEHYRMPATLCSKHGWKRTPIKPVFFAPTDIQPGELSEELQERLRASRNLIVICSPQSAKSEWVGKEIEFFHNLGRTKQIHFFIVDGVPHSKDPDTECFNPIVDQLDMPEILGANINERIYRWPWLNKERAYVQLISKLLGVEFDNIWQRHKRLLIRKSIAWALGILAVLAALATMWVKNQPFDVNVRLQEATFHNPFLDPLEDAIVTMELDNETKVDTIHNLGSLAIFTNIPHRFMNNQAHVTVSCKYFIDVDTILTLNKDITLNICRDPMEYGDVYFKIWNPNTEKLMSDVTVEIAGRKMVSDKEGFVRLFIPLEEQRKYYKITFSSIPLEMDTIYMPKSEEKLIIAK